GVAHSLALRGHTVQVLDPAFANGPSGSHEGHRSAAMTPALSRDDNPLSRLSRSGILLGRLRWKNMQELYEPCGTLLRIPAAEADAWRDALQTWRFPGVGSVVRRAGKRVTLRHPGFRGRNMAGGGRAPAAGPPGCST